MCCWSVLKLLYWTSVSCQHRGKFSNGQRKFSIITVYLYNFCFQLNLNIFRINFFLVRNYYYNFPGSEYGTSKEESDYSPHYSICEKFQLSTIPKAYLNYHLPCKFNFLHNLSWLNGNGMKTQKIEKNVFQLSGGNGKLSKLFCLTASLPLIDWCWFFRE